MTPKEVVQTMYDCFTTGDLIRVSGGIQLNRLPTQEEMYGQ